MDRSSFPEIYPIFIFWGILNILLCLLFFYSARKVKKYDRPFFLFFASSWLSIPLVCVLGMFLASEKLLIAAMFLLPFLLISLLSLRSIFQFYQCRVPVHAVCIGYEKGGRSGMYWYSPKFSYQWNGEAIQTQSFGYSQRTFNRLYRLNQEYLIYLDPDAPTHCADKRAFPGNSLAGLLIFLLFLLIAVFLIIII